MKTIAICSASDLLEGEIKGASLPDGTPIALYNINGNYYATHDICTHENASLSQEGGVEGDQVICGWHLCGFLVATGEAMASPCSEPLQTYPVKVVDGIIYVDY